MKRDLSLKLQSGYCPERITPKPSRWLLLQPAQRRQIVVIGYVEMYRMLLLDST